jgi:hypothetical protein
MRFTFNLASISLAFGLLVFAVSPAISQQSGMAAPQPRNKGQSVPPTDLFTLSYPELGIEFDSKSLGCRRNLLNRMRCRIAMVKTKGPKLPGQLLLVTEPSGGMINGRGLPLNEGAPARAKGENGGWFDSYDVRDNIPQDCGITCKQIIETGKIFVVEIHFQYAPKGTKLDRLSFEPSIFMYNSRKTVMFGNVPIVDVKTTEY